MTLRTMIKTAALGAIAAAATLAAGAPAMAQDWRGGGWDHGGYDQRPVSYGDFGGGGRELRDREDRMQVWIDRASDEGRLDGWRAHRASDELNRIRRAQRDLWRRQGGLAPEQIAWLNGRLDRLSGFIRADGGWDGGRRW